MFERKAIDLDEAVRMIDAYATIPIRIADPTLRQAAELLSQLNIRAYDAYIIGCAINQQAPILSLDRVLIDKAKSLDWDAPDLDDTLFRAMIMNEVADATQEVFEGAQARGGQVGDRTWDVRDSGRA